MAVPTVKLNNGIEMPGIGLGTYLARDVRTAVKMAIRLGYRMIDASFIYMNEHIVGNAVNERISDGSVKREDLFIVNKLWNTHHKPEKVLPALQTTLKNMKLEYLDLYLIHWPFGFQGDDYALLGPQEETPLEDTWKAMEECVKRGYTKSIGLSNFNESQIERILNICEIKPVVNQVECNLFFNQKEMIKFCKERDVVVMAYMPLFAPKRNFVENIFFNETVYKLVTKYGKTHTQIALRYLVQQGVVPVPKSEKPIRIKQNLGVFDFTISEEDMELLDKLNTNTRTYHYLGATEFKEYPFEVKFE